jgi:hypothetical protein
MSVTLKDRQSNKPDKKNQIRFIPCSKLPSDVQYTASGSPSALFSCLTANRTKIKSSMSPTQSNGRDRPSSHTGLNPLFFTVAVRKKSVRVDVPDSEAVPAGGAGTERDGAASGENGEEDQSGMCIETSTKGSTMDLSIISCPFASLGRGSCCAEII